MCLDLILVIYDSEIAIYKPGPIVKGKMHHQLWSIQVFYVPVLNLQQMAMLEKWAASVSTASSWTMMSCTMQQCQCVMDFEFNERTFM